MASSTGTARNQNGSTSGNAPTDGGKKSKAQATGQKLMVRQLPPLITEAEIQAVLGEEWQTGNGKVDWAQFHQGKVSKRYASPHGVAGVFC
jgi:regulator of nonsense transcripts 3